MAVVVCDDDPGVRSVVTGLVEERLGNVLAETDRSADAIALIERFEPDVIIVDLALAQGSGMDVIEFLADRPCITTRVVVFTSFDGVVDGGRQSVTVVRKPDFELLERCLDHSAWAAADEDRRRPGRPVVPTAVRRTGTDDPEDFYRVLADAHADDTLLCLSLEGLVAGDAVAAVRQTLRVQDLLIQRRTSLIALLIGGAESAPRAVCDRIRRDIPDVDERATGVAVGSDPIDSFMRLNATLVPC